MIRSVLFTSFSDIKIFKEVAVIYISFLEEVLKHRGKFDSHLETLNFKTNNKTNNISTQEKEICRKDEVKFEDPPLKAHITVSKINQEQSKHKYGEYGWVQLSDKEYQDLKNLMGTGEPNRCIEYIDSSAESTSNINHWKGWKAVLCRCFKHQ